MILNKIKLKAIKGIFTDKVFFLLLLCFSFLFYQLLDFQVLKEKSDGYYVGGANYGDLPAHLAYVTNFFYGQNFPPQNPFFSQTPLCYPFLADLVSALLLFLKLNLRTSIILSSFLFFITFFALNYFFVKQLFGKITAVFFLIVFLLGSNLGYGYFLMELIAEKKPLILAFQSLKHHYTFDFNIHFYSLFVNLFIPERSLLPGLILSSLVIILLFKGLIKKEKKNFLYAGFSLGLLPLWHTHSFLSLVILSVLLFFLFFSKDLWRNWFIFFAITLLLALPQIIWLLPAISKTRFFHWQFGWTKDEENFFLFWFKNLGPVFILAPLGLFQLKKPARKFFLPAFFLFLVANLISFQPWAWDNIKILIICFWFFSILTAKSLETFFKKGFWGKILTTILLFFLVASFPLAYRLETTFNYRLYSKRDFRLANWLIKNTQPQEVFITATNHNHPVTTLAGRRSLVGYPGYLWTHGINYKKREKLLPLIFSGRGELKKIFSNFNIAYVVFGNKEKQQYKEGLRFYQTNFPKIYEDEQFIIFKVKP